MAVIVQFPVVEGRGEPFDDEIEHAQNANWDKFLEVAKSAFEWRDHESLDELCQLIGALRPWILRQATEKVDKEFAHQLATILPFPLLP